MYVIRMEHPVPDYERWKRAFDNDPLGREQAGVRRYRIFRAADAANHVLIDLEFDTLGPAEAMLAALRAIWGRVEGTVMANAQARIVEQVEERTLGSAAP